ncbi:site-specific integrase [Glaesserella parasuis]|uniref:tyrosine-type recombinase/integrase n=1 Tax=Glaesserella parasuis TaxID=738 RepID=UPI0024368C60|nr:site-specific integrase [Glaesserella parasuis]MDG6230312.1 site-specific integrase [Glaesserella parasuis]MDO9950289.1 site-specific integrase [Glaesserella parasuis]
MATIIKRGDKWRVQINKKGIRKNATFSTKVEASRWAISVESQIEAGEYSSIPKMTFAELIDKYVAEVTVNKGGAREESLRLNRIAKTPLGTVELEDLSKEHFEKWQDKRLTEVSVLSVLRERVSLSAVVSQAIKWEFLKSNPLSLVDKPKEPPPRTRRYSQDEIDRLLFVSGFDFDKQPETMISRVGASILFAIETAMRAGEICNLKWEDVDFNKSTAFLPKTKNGFARTVPLSSTAIKILRHLEKVKSECNQTVFQVKSSSHDAIFRKMKELAGLADQDLHFHDTRREALSRLAKKVDVMTLAKISGHRDIKILLNTYYAPDMSDVAGILG